MGWVWDSVWGGWEVRLQVDLLGFVVNSCLQGVFGRVRNIDLHVSGRFGLCVIACYYWWMQFLGVFAKLFFAA